MSDQPRPEVVQALVSAWNGETAALDELTGVGVTAQERETANALVAALGAVGGAGDDRLSAANEYLGELGLQDTPPARLAREHPDAWQVYRRILLAVDELD